MNHPSLANSGSAPTNSTLSIVALVVGILSITIGWCCGGIVFPVVGIVLSCIALSQINKEPLKYQGTGFATTGLVLSSIACILTLLWVIVYIVFVIISIFIDSTNRF